MGIIRQQGSQHAFLLYLGVVVGGVSTLFVYPLNTELYGYAQFLLATALLLASVSNLGINALAVKFFPRLKDSPRQGGVFFTWLNALNLAAFGLFAVLALIFKSRIIQFLSRHGFENAHILEDHYSLILSLTYLAATIVLARQQGMNYRKIVIPAIISEFSYKLFLPSLVLYSTISSLSNTQYGIAYLIFQISVLILLWIYLYGLGGIKIKFNWKEVLSPFTKKELTSFALFNTLTKIGNVLIFKVDAFMITLMLGAGSTGIYFIYVFMANIVQIPFRSINLIGSPMISKSWANRDFAGLSEVYKKSSLILTIVGAGLFVSLWAVLPDLILISPKTETLQSAIFLFFILGLAKLTDALTSVNEQILVYSPKYAYNILIILFVGVSNVILNYILIPNYGLLGVAIASLISIAAYNLIKVLFIYYHFRLHPFSLGLLKALAIALVCFGLLYYGRSIDSIFLRLPFMFVVMVIFYLIPILKFKISPEFNDLVHQVLSRLPFLPLSNDK